MDVGHRFAKWIWSLAVCFMLGLAACQSAAPLAPAPTAQLVLVPPTWTASAALSPSSTATETPSPSTSPEATSDPALVLTADSTPAAVFYEPAGCWLPPDDYTRLSINGTALNARTYAMLQQAALLYGGEIEVAGSAIILGSYSDNDPDGLGAHLGGGAVDISVIRPNTQTALYLEIEPLIRALRTVGFAAWLRDQDETKIHIHAIAIGDRELSPAAQEQLSGPAGYLRGFDGLPVPGLDRHGGPVICGWMLESGYADLRPPTPSPTPGLAWQERLRQAALAYLANYPEDAEVIARNLDFIDGQNESTTNVCGPLAAAILRDAGLLPAQAGPVQVLKSYWLARPIDNGRPWSLFSERDYEVFHYDTPLAEFDFVAWPLQPGDFLYTYAKGGGFEHMFVVTEVDAEGRAYTVTNQYQIWGGTLIQRYLLYDPQIPGAGIIYNQWSDSDLGMTGHNGFDVLRKRGLAAGTLYAYSVRPGDTLPDLAARFGALPESLAEANPGLDLVHLQVGQPLTIPIPPYSPVSPESVQGGAP